MALPTVLDSRFRETLKQASADYFRALHAPGKPQGADKAETLFRYFSELIPWVKLVDRLFSPSTCTAQFWEKFGPELKPAWLDVRQDLNPEPTKPTLTRDCLYRVTDLASFLKLMEYRGQVAFNDVVTRWADYRVKKDGEKTELPANKRNSTAIVWQWMHDRASGDPAGAQVIDNVDAFLREFDAYQKVHAKIRWPPKNLPQYWESASHLFDECLRVLVRLTQQPDGALVALWDLLDAQQYDRYLVIREIFAWATKEAPAPVPYDAGAAVFTKVSETFTVIQQLVRSFDDWEKTPGKK